MLDELVLEISGRRYVGHVWAEPGPPRLDRRITLRWHFSRWGHLVAEFPATELDTPTTVRARLVAQLSRMGSDLPN
jgi:hypothetical protein